MSQRDNGKFQRKISELEKFISSVLESPMNLRIKRKILDDLESYKGTILTSKDESPLKNTVLKKGRCKPRDDPS